MMNDACYSPLDCLSGHCFGGKCASYDVAPLNAWCSVNAQALCATGLYCGQDMMCHTKNLTAGMMCDSMMMMMGAADGCVAGQMCTMNQTDMTTWCMASPAGKACATMADCGNAPWDCQCSSATSSTCVNTMEVMMSMSMMMMSSMMPIQMCMTTGSAMMDAGCMMYGMNAVDQQSGTTLGALSTACKTAIAHTFCCVACTNNYADAQYLVGPQFSFTCGASPMINFNTASPAACMDPAWNKASVCSPSSPTAAPSFALTASLSLFAAFALAVAAML